MEFIIHYNDQDHFVDVDPKDEEKTVGDVRNDFAADMGLYEERFRFVIEETGEILHDPTPLTKLNQWQEVSRGPSEAETDPSDKDAESIPEEGAAAKRKSSDERPADNSDEDKKSEEEEEIKVGDDDGEPEEKGQLDSSEEEKSALRQKAEMILRLVDRCMEQHSVDHEFIRNEIITVMRMSRDEANLPMRGARVPRAQRLRVRVEEGYPVFMSTFADGTKHLACLANDTVGQTRERFAMLYKTPVQNLIIRKEVLEGESDILEVEDDGMSLNELGMDEGTAFAATRTGEQEVYVVFGFSICIKIKVNMERSVTRIKRQVERRAPDFKGVKFYMWYNGIRVREDDKEENEPLMGNVIMGLHFLRVMLELDPDLPVSVDPGPDMRVKRPRRNGQTIIRRRGRYGEDEEGDGGDEKDKDAKEKNSEKDNSHEENGAAKNGKNGKKKNGKNGAKNGKSSSDDGKDEKKKKKKKKKNGNGNGNGRTSSDTNSDDGVIARPVRFDLNKRVLRYFTMLIECQLVENLAQGIGDHNAPITLENLLPNMRLRRLRELIEIHSQEKPEHQTLFLEGKPLNLREDYKTLRELGLDKVNTLYMEPALNVTVKIDDKPDVELRLAARSTTFAHVAEILEDKAGIPREHVFLLYKGVPALPQFTFSEYNIQSGNVLTLRPPFRVRAWHNCYLFDGLFWSHSSPDELKAWLEKETKIPVAKQVISHLDGPQIPMDKKPMLDTCGIKKECEIEVFVSDDLPDRLKNPSAGGAAAHPSGWVQSAGDGDDDDDDDDDDVTPAPEGMKGQYVAAEEGAAGGGAFSQFIESHDPDDSDDDDPEFKQ